MARGINLRPRLHAAAALLGQQRTVADIGCDHGRLSIALLQQGFCQHVIATDVGQQPLKRAQTLRNLCGMESRMELRLGDGFGPIRPGEVQAAAICGMGGTLMSRILEDCVPPLKGAALLVLQPMRAVADIRSYLFFHCYRVVDDVVVRDAGRLYQVFSVVANQQDILPAGWPEGFFDLGHRALESRSPLFLALLEQMLGQHRARLLEASGTCGALPLEQKIQALEQIRAMW